MQQKVKTVENYIKMSGSDAAKKLTELRKVILSTAPKAEEKLSYGMPLWIQGPLGVFCNCKNSHRTLYSPARFARPQKRIGKVQHVKSNSPLPAR